VPAGSLPRPRSGRRASWSGEPVEVHGEVPDGLHVGLLRIAGQLAQLHVLDHAAPQFGHGPSPSGR
jgi:hypothetical protein